MTKRGRDGRRRRSHEKKKPRNHLWLRGLRVAGCTGLEPVASGVTGRRYNRLN